MTAADASAAKQRPAEHHSSSAESDAGPGLGSVVWAREKGWPHWPALLITKETSRGLCNLRKSLHCLGSTSLVSSDSARAFLRGPGRGCSAVCVHAKEGSHAKSP